MNARPQIMSLDAAKPTLSAWCDTDHRAGLTRANSAEASVGFGHSFANGRNHQGPCTVLIIAGGLLRACRELSWPDWAHFMKKAAVRAGTLNNGPLDSLAAYQQQYYGTRENGASAICFGGAA